jgi:hypothetical protein
MAKASKKTSKAPTLSCRVCSARHAGAYSRDLCADCLAKTASGEVRLLNGQYACRSCAGRVVTDAEGGVRCEHYCFSAAAR